MTIRTSINPFEGTITVEKLVVNQVPTIKYQMVQVPEDGAMDGWGFMKHVSRPYTAIEDVYTWVVAEVRKATEKELEAAMGEVMTSILD